MRVGRKISAFLLGILLFFDALIAYRLFDQGWPKIPESRFQRYAASRAGAVQMARRLSRPRNSSPPRPGHLYIYEIEDRAGPV